MSIKRMIKQLITIINHPIVSLHLLSIGSNSFYIAPQMTVNSLKGLMIGNNIRIGRNSRFLLVSEYYGGKYEPLIKIGNNCSIGNRFSALSAASIEIGENVLIASDVLITSENHGMNPELSNNYINIPLEAKPVKIGDGCWIGEKVSILPGVMLGERCIVGAHSVVTKSFPAYSLIAGSPAKMIKKYDFEKKEWIPCNNER